MKKGIEKRFLTDEKAILCPHTQSNHSQQMKRHGKKYTSDGSKDNRKERRKVFLFFFQIFLLC